MSKADLAILLAPEIIVLLTGLVALFVDATLMRARSVPVRLQMALLVTVVGCLGTICWLTQTGQPPIRIYDGMLTVTPLTQLMKQLLLVLTIFTALITSGSDFTEHVGEYFLLLLLATVGMMFLVSSDNVLILFVSLEVLSLSLYIMTAFNKGNIRSVEAALKYFLFGGMSAAFLLFGLSLLYGVSGALQLSVIAANLKTQPLDPLLLVALLMVVAGFGFKIAAVPFHLWAPDAYEGAPAPSAAFIASGSKVASFFILAKVMMVAFDGVEGSGSWQKMAPGWISAWAVVALLSVVLGNLAAIAQRSVRRLLAYSAIAHAGYTLIGILANDDRGLASVIFYAATYALTTLGAFTVVAIVQKSATEERFSSFAGLGQRAPVVAFCMMIFMLSLAGIPPLAGFFGKFYLFTAALAAAPGDLALLWLVIAAIAMSAVSLYYYLQVLKEIYVAAPSPAQNSPAPPVTLTVAVALLALAIVVLGCAPDLLLARILTAIRAGI